MSLSQEQVLQIVSQHNPDGTENAGDTSVWTVWQSGQIGDSGRGAGDRVECYIREHDSLKQVAVTYTRDARTDYFDTE